MDDFINLHHHDTFSPFDGLCIPEDNVKRIVELGQKGLAQTNHGNTSGLIQHFKYCKENNINPIMGCEAYFVLDNLVKERKSYHITLLAKNDNGYSNLMQLMTEANITGFYYKPRIDVKSLLTYQKDIIVLSGCQNSIIYQYFLEDKYEKAEKLTKLFYERLDNFYLEIQPHDIDNQRKVNEFAIKMHDKYDIPLVMTIDSHYTTKKEAIAQLYLRAFKILNSKLKDYAGLYLHSRRSVIDFWKRNYIYTKKIKEAIDNTVKINDMCDVSLDFGNLSTINWGENSTKLLIRKVKHGLKRINKYNNNIYKDRIRKEMNMIIKRNFEDLFLLCEDVVKEANRQNIKTGFGRGSGVSSLIAYCLGITKVDPIQYNLLFERFLTEERKGMPDVDIDFDSRHRNKIFKYIEEKYSGQQAQVSNYGKYKVRNLLNDFYKLLCLKGKELSKEQKNKITYETIETIESGENIESNKYLMKFSFMKYFKNIYKNIRYFGTHASGVAICKDISKYVSIVRRGNNFVTCYDLKDLEYLGILKLDILGLNTLSVLSTVEEKTGCSFNTKILNNNNLYAKFANLQTDAIFQFDSRTAKETLKQIKPENLEELTASTAINRPACLKNGMVLEYAEAKYDLVDKTKLWYKYSKDTYGCMIYQEQVMKILIEVGKCNTEFSYKFIKTASKRETLVNMKQEVNSEIFIEFYEHFKQNTKLTKLEIEELYFNIMRYLFNKSHALAYTITSVYQMWQFVKYPLESLFALLINEDDDEKQKYYEILAASKNILIFLPHVNSSANYSLKIFDNERVIMKGLSQIKGVGKGTAKEIERNRIVNFNKYTNKEELIETIPKKILRKNVIEALEFSGALNFNRNNYIRRCIQYNAQLRNDYKNYYSYMKRK